jgi:hypothetical protein
MGDLAGARRLAVLLAGNLLAGALLALGLPAPGAAGAGAELPPGCRAGTGATVDYPGAVDCVVWPPETYDCNVSPAPYPACSYRGADRPHDLRVDAVVIHDIEGTARAGIATFRKAGSGVAMHYVVGRDGTVYQTLRERDFAFHVGNLWANRHSVGIEHEGYAATGWQWYSAAQYEASARLTAYLLDRYDLPADRAHVLGHGAVPRPDASSANHLDPGPYWLWDHYLHRVRAAAPALRATRPGGDPRVFTLRTGRVPGPGGAQTPADFGYFYLYRGPSTDSGLIPQAANGSQVTDGSNNVEVGMSYVALDSRPDGAGTGARMVEIWYGHADAAHAEPADLKETARRAWLAVPPGVAMVPGIGRAVTLGGPGASDPVPVYGSPTADAAHTLGSAPAGAVFAAMRTVPAEVDGKPWYAITYDHRFAYVPASAVTDAGP